MGSMTSLIDVGMSGEDMAETYKIIYDELYNPVIEDVEKNTNTLINGIETYWIGSSADKFKKYIEYEKDLAIQKLGESIENIRVNLVNVSSDMQAIDVLAASMIDRGQIGDIEPQTKKESIPSSLPVVSDTVSTDTAEEIDVEATKIDIDDLTGKTIDKSDKLSFVASVGATLALHNISQIEGLGKFGEAIVDGTAIIGAGTLVAPVTGIIDLIGYNVSKSQGKKWKSVTGKVFDGVRGYVQDENCKSMFDDYVYNSSINKYAFAFDFNRKVGNGIGYSAPTILIAVASGGASLLPAITPTVTAFVTGVGKGSESSWKDGASTVKGLIYGTLRGGLDAALMQAGIKINNFNPFSSLIPNVLTHAGLNAGVAATEAFAEPGMKAIYKEEYLTEAGQVIAYTKDDDFIERYKTQFKEAGGFENVGFRAGTAGLITIGAEATGIAKEIRKNTSTTKSESVYSFDDYMKDKGLDLVSLHNKHDSKKMLEDIASPNEKVINEFKGMNKVITDFANIKRSDGTLMKETLDFALDNKGNILIFNATTGETINPSKIDGWETIGPQILKKLKNKGINTPINTVINNVHDTNIKSTNSNLINHKSTVGLPEEAKKTAGYIDWAA